MKRWKLQALFISSLQSTKQPKHFFFFRQALLLNLKSKMLWKPVPYSALAPTISLLELRGYQHSSGRQEDNLAILSYLETPTMLPFVAQDTVDAIVVGDGNLSFSVRGTGSFPSDTRMTTTIQKLADTSLLNHCVNAIPESYEPASGQVQYMYVTKSGHRSWATSFVPIVVGIFHSIRCRDQH